MSILFKISEQLQEGSTKVVADLVKRALDEGTTADQILKDDDCYERHCLTGS